MLIVSLMKTPMTWKYFPPCDVTRVARGANWNEVLIPVRRYPHMQRKISCTVIKLCVLPPSSHHQIETLAPSTHWRRQSFDTAKKGKTSYSRLLMNVCPAAKWSLHNLHGWNLQENVGGKKKYPMPLLVAVRGYKGSQNPWRHGGSVRSAEGDTEWAALWWLNSLLRRFKVVVFSLKTHTHYEKINLSYVRGLERLHRHRN